MIDRANGPWVVLIAAAKELGVPGWILVSKFKFSRAISLGLKCVV